MMLCRNKVADFERWKAVFDSHRPAHRSAGLRLKKLWRNIDDPSDVFFLFKVKDEAKARAFINAPDASVSKAKSGVLVPPELYFLK